MIISPENEDYSFIYLSILNIQSSILHSLTAARSPSTGLTGRRRQSRHLLWSGQRSHRRLGGRFWHFNPRRWIIPPLHLVHDALRIRLIIHSSICVCFMQLSERLSIHDPLARHRRSRHHTHRIRNSRSDVIRIASRMLSRRISPRIRHPIFYIYIPLAALPITN